MFQINSVDAVRSCLLPLTVCDLALHLETFTGAQRHHDHAVAVHDEDERTFERF